MSLRHIKLWQKHQKKDASENLHRVPSHIKCWFKELGWRFGRQRYDCEAFNGTRRIRVLFHLHPIKVQICDGNFDRWANSVAAEMIGLPNSKQALHDMIKTLKIVTIFSKSEV